MNTARLAASEELAAQIGVNSTMIELAILSINETAGNRWEKVRNAVWYLYLDCGLPGHQSIRAANLAADRLGLSF